MIFFSLFREIWKRARRTFRGIPRIHIAHLEQVADDAEEHNNHKARELLPSSILISPNTKGKWDFGECRVEFREVENFASKFSTLITRAGPSPPSHCPLSVCATPFKLWNYVTEKWTFQSLNCCSQYSFLSGSIIRWKILFLWPWRLVFSEWMMRS